MIIMIFGTLFLSLLIVHVLLQYNKPRRMISKIPGPAPLPFFGNILMFNVSSEKVWDTIQHIGNKFYPLAKVQSFMLNLVFIRHPDDMKTLASCKKNIEKSETVYETIRTLGNEGLITSGGEKWQQRRKMLNAGFSPESIKVYIEIANEHAEKFVKNIKNKSVEVIPDLLVRMNAISMEIVCEATMGVGFNASVEEKAAETRHSFAEISEIIYSKASRPYLRDWMLKLLPSGRRIELAKKNIREFIEKVIKDRREYYKTIGYRKFQNLVDNVYDETSTSTFIKGKRKRLAVLDLLLAAERDNLIDKRGVIEEVETIILAGYETTGVALTFVLMLLAENTEAQGLARDEVTEIMNQTEGTLLITDLNKLDYLDRCIKETLRLYPSAPIVGRNIKHEIKFSNCEIPHGTEVILNFFALHRDPNFWPNPEKFDPDRFLPENIEKRHPFAYLPFSGGLRSCIGYKFAMLEMKAIVARILYNFYLEPVQSAASVKFEMYITLKPKDPCKIRFIEINRK